MKTYPKQALLFIAILFFYSDTEAQTAVEASQKFGKHFSVSVLLGPGVNAPAKSIEEGMKTNDFGHTSPAGCFFIFCIPETDYPKSNSGISWIGKLTYHPDPYYGVSLMYSVYKFGDTKGYNSSVGKLGIEHKLYSISPQLTFGFHDIISISAGPALHSLKMRDRASQTYEINRKLGVDADISLRLPKKSLFFLTLNLRYMLAGNYSIGPFTKTVNEATVTFSEVRVNYNQLTVNYGFGIRL